nr:hypothetical protein [Chlamydia abortus]
MIQLIPSRLLTLKGRKNNEVLELLHVDQNGRLAFPDDKAASDPVLVNAITELMELSFAVSMSFLRDLEAYREKPRSYFQFRSFG